MFTKLLNLHRNKIFIQILLTRTAQLNQSHNLSNHGHVLKLLNEIQKHKNNGGSAMKYRKNKSKSQSPLNNDEDKTLQEVIEKRFVKKQKKVKSSQPPDEMSKKLTEIPKLINENLALKAVINPRKTKVSVLNRPLNDSKSTTINDNADNYINYDDVSSVYNVQDVNNVEYESYEDSFMIKKNLLSFIHLCLYQNQIADAHEFLMNFINNKLSASVLLSTAEIGQCCELLLKGMARNGAINDFETLFSYMKNDLKLNMNLNVYEYYLLAICKQMTNNIANYQQNKLREILDEISSNNLKNENLLMNSRLNSAEIQSIKRMLRKYAPELRLNKYSYPKHYNNRLVDRIVGENDQKLYEPFDGIDLSTMNEWIDQQFQIEMNSITKIQPIEACFNNNPNNLHDAKKAKSKQFYRKLINNLENDWREKIRILYEKYVETITVNKKKLNGIPFQQYMTILSPSDYVDIMIEEIHKCSTFSEYYSPFSSQLFEQLGRKVMQKYLNHSNQLDGTIDDFKRCYFKYVDYLRNPELMRSYNPRQYWYYLLENHHNENDNDDQEYYHYYFDESKQWPLNILREIGKDLYENILSEIKFNSDAITNYYPELKPFTLQPVISFFYKNHEQFKTKKEVRVNPLLVQLYEQAGTDIYFESERLPMLAPPLPWLNTSFGGNLLIHTFIVRLPLYFPKHRLKQHPLQQFYPTFDSLNSLSLCPWKINEPILDLAIHIFKNNGNIDLDIPVSLSYFGPLPRSSSEMSRKERAIVYYRRKLQKKEQAEMYSLWVDCLYKLSIGNSLRNKYFWFPINTDFRSRVYPIPPNFNHLGNDLSRALLLFGKGKPLGPKGLQWLKIHLINLTGLKKKCSIQQRLEYADEIIDLIMDSADNPLGGQKWWMQSDEKWQTLACCIELTNALRSPDPHEYVSHMPIHQDGSCNGLQHYAALGRDILGAKSVNLCPSEYPQDVYSDVARLVEEEIEKDLQNNNEIAKIVKGFINRKIVKQTVMTYVYGVTKYGAKLQVLKRLKEDSNFPESHKVTASVYVSEKILHSIRRMFTQTRLIQDWLTDCAQILSNDYQMAVEWVTPLGFPVIQAYYKTPRKNNGQPLKLIPNVMKQKNAFPANFIHSLDSSHMMLTSLECYQNGLTFSSVHDCYWTHATDIDEMNYYCRKQFISLHSEPILDNLAKFLRQKLEYCEQQEQLNQLKFNFNNNQSNNQPRPSMIPRDNRNLIKQIDRRIPKGEFELNSVMDSTYFFS